MTDGDMVSWRGDNGECYFYQAELPYHKDDYSTNGYVGYAVAPGVQHTARGMGVYIISSPGITRCAYRLPASTTAENLITVVVLGELWQFGNTVCLATDENGVEAPAFKPQACEGSRCITF